MSGKNRFGDCFSPVVGDENSGPLTYAGRGKLMKHNPDNPFLFNLFLEPFICFVIPFAAENLCNSSPVDHSNNTRTIFEEPGVFTPAKESEHDVVMVKQEIVTAVPFHDRIDVKRRRKRRFSRDEDQLTKIKSFKVIFAGFSSFLS